MSHPSSSVSAASTMIRPKLLFLSTEDVEEYSDASKVTITLRDPVIAEDGFKLVYGIRSFGYNTNVMNISQRQGNNVFDIAVTYLTPSKIYQGESVQPLTQTPTYETTVYSIYIPDDNYSTLEILFKEINAQIENSIYSGWLRDFAASDQKPDNRVPFKIIFSQINNNRMLISIRAQDLVVQGGYIFGSTEIRAYEFASKITSISIQPTPEKENLYELLFTNVTSFSFTKPICVPSFSSLQGLNPPTAIVFNIDPTKYGTYNPLTFTSFDTDVWSSIEWDLLEIGNEHILDTAKKIHPLQIYSTGYGIAKRVYKSLDYLSYALPSIYPFYLDISTTLENSNLTTEGLSRNLLTRQFIVGSKDGNSSFFQAWDTPIYYILDSRRISTMEIKFDSQKNKWNFFNLEFTLEIVVFEVEDEASPADFVEPSFVLPAEDSFTSTLSQYSSSIQNPHPILGSGQSRKSVAFNDVMSRRVRKRNNS